ncbi:hypothetical protein ACOUDP_03980 [Acinetobacter baumannii]
MTQLFFKAENFVSDRALPVLNDVGPIVPNLENNSYDHWVFKDSSASLKGVVNGHLLTLQQNAAYMPVFSNSGVTISTAMGNALISDIVDSSDQSITMAAVVKCNTIALSILLGNLVPSNSTTSSGLSGFASGGKTYLTVKPTTLGGPGGISSLACPSNISQTSNFFIAISVDKVTKQGIIFTKQADIETSNETTYTAATYDASLNNHALGNSAYSGQNTLTNLATFAEAIFFNKALNMTELQGLATRSKSRMADRGIIL